MKGFFSFLFMATMAASTLWAADAPPALKFIRVDSEDTEGAGNRGVNAVDGDPTTFWHTQWQGGSPGHPHEIIFQLNKASKIEGVSYLPRQDGNPNGMIKGYEIYLSDDGKNFGQPVKRGEFAGGGGGMRFALFDARQCSHVKVVALSSVTGGPLTSAAEFGVVTTDTFRTMMAAAERAVPSAKSPFTVPTDPAAQKLLVQQIRGYMALPPEVVRAHKSSADFPGVAPAGSARVKREVVVGVPAVDKSLGWQSTGLYANAGEIVTVQAMSPLPEGVTIEIQVGSHGRENFSEYFPTWERFPMLMRTFTLGTETTPVASALGGTLYAIVRNDAGPQIDGTTIALRFANAVEAPHFVLGKTTPAQWKRSRTAPAPMGELACNGLILHVPSTLLRAMDDPTPLMKWWDSVVAAQDALASWPARTVAERVVFEPQLGGAWGFSGYPVQIDASGAAHAVNLEALRKDGDWGIFHEIGHNHQSDEWTFYKNPILEQSEVTVNFFSLYCMEHVVGKPRGTGHPAIEGEELFKALNKRFGNAPSDDAFEQLSVFVVLIRQYGWEPMKKTIASYVTSPMGDEVSEPDRQAEFVKRYSKFANADLGGFFKRGGYNVPKKVIDELKTLPEFDYAKWRKEAKGK